MHVQNVLAPTRALRFPTVSRAALETPPASVHTRVRYIKRPRQEKLFLYVTEPPADVGKTTNLELDEVPVHLTDLRTAAPSTLQQNGLELVKFPRKNKIDWEDEQQVKTEYYPEVAELIKRMTGGSQVSVIMHAVRRGKIERGHLDLAELKNKGSPISRPSVLTHIDFTTASGPTIFKKHLGEKALEANKKPWGIVQVWQPVVGPVQDSALGFIDAATVSPEDVLPVQLHLSPEQTHEVNYLAHNPSHRWMWTSQMQEDEAYVFVNYMSKDNGQSRYTPHGTIIDSTIPADVPIRQSIETRAFVFWDE